MSLKYQVVAAYVATVSAQNCEPCLTGTYNAETIPTGGEQTCADLFDQCALEDGGLLFSCYFGSADGTGNCAIQTHMAEKGCCGTDAIPVDPPTCDTTCDATDVCPHGVIEDGYFIDNDVKYTCSVMHADWLTNPDNYVTSCEGVCAAVHDIATAKGCCKADPAVEVTCAVEDVCPHGVNPVEVYDDDKVLNFAPWNSPTFNCQTEIDLCRSDDGALSSARCQGGCQDFATKMAALGCCKSSADHADWTTNAAEEVCPNGVTAADEDGVAATVTLINFGDVVKDCQDVLDFCTSDEYLMDSHVWCKAGITTGTWSDHFKDYMRVNMCCEGYGESSASGAATFVALALGFLGLFQAW